MKRYEKLMLTTAVAALAIGLGAPRALAFDQVNWTWNGNVDTHALQKIWDFGSFMPEGLTMIELNQTQLGDVVAIVNIRGDFARDPGDGSPTTKTIDLGTIKASIKRDGDALDGKATQKGGDVDLDPTVNHVATGGKWDDKDGSGREDIDLGSVTIDVPGSKPDYLNAPTELAQVRGAATAVANSSSVTSAVKTDIDLNQTHNGNFGTGALVTAQATAGYKGFSDGALVIPPDPTEAAAQLDATAIANASSITLASATEPRSLKGGGNLKLSDFHPGAMGPDSMVQADHDPVVAAALVTNELLTANITQSNVGGVTATTSAFQDLSGFDNLGQYKGLRVDGKLVPGLVANLNATAIGNLSNISVTGPTSK